VKPALCTDSPSLPVAAAAAAACIAGSNQPHLSPLTSSAAKDEAVTFLTKQPTTVGISGERQVLNLLLTI